MSSAICCSSRCARWGSAALLRRSAPRRPSPELGSRARRALESEERRAETGDARSMDLRLQLGMRVPCTLTDASRSTWRRSARTDASVLRKRPLRSIVLIADPAGASGAGERTLSLGVPVKTKSARCASGARNLPPPSATTGRARLIAAGTAESSGNSNAILASSASSMSSRRRHPWRRAVHDQRDPLAVEAQPVDRLEPDPDVLQRRHLGIADEQQLVGVVERREQRSVEERPGVDDDRVVGGASGLQHGSELLLTHDVRLFGPPRRGEQ